MPRLGIVQVAKIPGHPSLEGARIGPLHQQIQLVIELQQQAIAAGKTGHQVRGNASQIGQDAKGPTAGIEPELHRLTGIVGYRHCGTGDGTDAEAGTCVHQHLLMATRQAIGGGCAVGQVNGNTVPL